MAKPPPQYLNDLPGFVGDLRSLVFPSQAQAARYFHVSRPTITRYENGTHPPPLGYIACLARLVAEQRAETSASTYRETLLQEVNRAIRANYDELPFQDWDEVGAIAAEHLTKQQNRSAFADSTSHLIQKPFSSRFFIEALRDWSQHVFRWSEASEHMRSSWTGMVIYMLSAVLGRFTPRGLLIVSVSLALGIATAYLMMPILQWPLVEAEARRIAYFKYGLATWLIPLLVALVTPPDRPDLFALETRKQHLTFWLLKFVGALVGFWVFSVGMIGVALIGYYLYLPRLAGGVRAVLALVPLFFSYVAARRIPADRHKMFNGELRLHEADRFFLVAFLGIGPISAFFLYTISGFISDRSIGPLLALIALTLVTLWEYRKQHRKAVSDLTLILILGLVVPSLLVLLALFLTPNVSPLAPHELPSLILAVIYLLGWTSLLATLLVRNQLTLTLPGVLSVLILTIVANVVTIAGRWWGAGFLLTVGLLWGLWGRKRFKDYLRVHGSFWGMMVATGGGVYFLWLGITPLWTNGLGFLLVAIILLGWAYRAREKV